MPYTEVPVDMTTLNQCVSQASQVHGIHPIFIKTLIAVEGGQIGTNMRNTNNTYDMGVMQINTVNFKAINKKFGYSMRDLIIDPCKNIMAGTWLLWLRMQETPKKLWVAVGNYHSKTPAKRHNYLSKVEKAYSGLMPVYGKPGEAKAIGRTTNWGKAVPLMAANEQHFPSIKELEALVADGRMEGSAKRSNQAQASGKARRPQAKPNVVTINSKRKVLRFID